MVERWIDAGGRFTQRIDQADDGITHYIIRPVLKHVAIHRIRNSHLVG